jgi:hypothetical protein
VELGMVHCTLLRVLRVPMFESIWVTLVVAD